MREREHNLLRSLTETSTRFYLWVGALAAVVLWGAMAYLLQYRRGLIVTGMRDEISWGLYITNFVFFIGISHAGTLISAILRVTQTEWRRPITRMAEAITVFALCVGAPMVIIDLGRPERLLNLFRFGRIQSPILWDVLSVTTYLTGCILYFYIPMIPDLAILAEQPKMPGWRRRIYRALSLGWTGSNAQQELLERAISIMAIIIIPLAVSVHTVVSWIFSMTLRPGWNSSIFGPYFVVGAIFSGSAAVILSMYVLRRVFHLEEYVEPVHFRNLGILLLAFSLLYLYFNINEYLTLAYKYERVERALLDRLFWGDAAPAFWTVQALGVFIPMLLLIVVLGWRRYHGFTIPGVALASLLVIGGAWAKRYIIIIPTLSSPFLPPQGAPPEWTHYHPTWVEWSITAAAFAFFLLIYTLLSKLFPIISIWETRVSETREPQPESAAAPAPRWWNPAPPMAAVLIVLLLGAAIPAWAKGKKSQPRLTSLAVEWQPATPAQVQAASAEEPANEGTSPGRVYLFLGRMFGSITYGSRGGEEEKAPSPIAVTATLHDDQGQPLSFQAVDFSLQTAFGNLAFGSRPTNEQGTVQLVVRDRRYGKFRLQVDYAGDEDHQASRAQIVVDFGMRPAPALPREGILISPYPTAAIGVPFLLFYGIMWVVFVYAFGYLVLWRMRRAARLSPPSLPPPNVPAPIEPLPPLG
jgi:molybdopterin-containing oxidoreductase family membrane subunit